MSAMPRVSRSIHRAASLISRLSSAWLTADKGGEGAAPVDHAHKLN